MGSLDAQTRALYASAAISKEALDLVQKAESALAGVFEAIDGVEAHNQLKVLSAFHKNGVSARHFNPSLGYGYDDIGRDTLERVFADAFGAQDALVRPQIASGTHAIALALFGLLSPGDALLSITGKPYDTLEQAIGISGNASGSLKSLGVKYKQLELTDDGAIDTAALENALDGAFYKVIFVQRSRGYAWRDAQSVDALAEVFKLIKAKSPKSLIVVDNCYGEFTGLTEPVEAGAHVMAGSLIKNPGGGIAPTGGYVAGQRDCIEAIAQRLTSPGIGREVGSYAAGYTPFYQGFFLAPHVTAQALKTAALFARVFEELGLETLPKSTARRADIIQAVRFKTKEQLLSFCKSIQRAAPVDSFVSPEPWDMPGYTHQVVMAAGAFVQGSSIELSADAPIIEPYTAYVQGSLTYSHGRIGVLFALNELIKEV